jgi:hypothetical protein
MIPKNLLLSLPLLLEEPTGIVRCDEPVTVGIPLPQGAVYDPAALVLVDPGDHLCPLQAQALTRWCDGSVRWILLDFQASVAANGKAIYQLRRESKSDRGLQYPDLIVQQSAEEIVVNTGRAVFFLNTRICKPFDRVLAGGNDLVAVAGSSLVLTDDAGQEYEPYIQGISVETAGPLRVTVKAQGELRAASRTALARFIVRTSFYVGSSFIEMRVTLHNPCAARHRGGLWDLGYEGSIYFKDLSLHIPWRIEGAPHVAWATQPLQPYIAWATQPSQPLTKYPASSFMIYQDSSGGRNWQSSNHVNRFGNIAQTFRGYRVIEDGRLLEEGGRATPVLVMSDERGGVAATIGQFWQNFPKALEARGHELILRLFPQQFNDVFELQGGEQKTHTIYLQFSGPEEEAANLSWVHERLIPRATPEWYAHTKACSYLSPRSQDHNTECLELVDTAITGPQSFFARREIIDEYGWRHFGDLYADHEAVGHTGETPLVAHYNNQYDVIYGAIVQYLRSGDGQWFELARDLARHVIDIDIYHTQEDRPAYNGGLFWHTDHYLDAATATHRAYSKANLRQNAHGSYGGGPANEQNYTSGLLHYYYLTGDTLAREAVLLLADWVIAMDDGSLRLFGFLDKRPTGLCSSTAERNYHGPGRGAGNSINALLDAHALTHEKRYLAKAEQLIRRCIHPKDNIQKRNLDDPERRWSYLVFLQVLGKYLDLKIEKAENDYMYGYAQASLLHYAEWMLEHEVPYSQVLDRVEIPTETWPAQDIRKSVVFYSAAKHATELRRSVFRTKAAYFFETCLRDLKRYPTCTLTRPLVLLLTNAYAHPYFQMHPEEEAPGAREQYDFDQPRQFKPQFSELHWLRGKIAGWLRAMRIRRHWMRGLGRNGRIVLGAHDG